MNPLLQAALGSIVRWVLAFVAGWLVQHGIWTQADAETYVAAAALAVVGLLWSLWQKYRTSIVISTALSLPAGSSEEKLAETVSRGGAG